MVFYAIETSRSLAGSEYRALLSILSVFIHLESNRLAPIFTSFIFIYHIIPKMEGVWADEYEDDDFLDYYGEAEEVPEPERKKTKLIDQPEDPNDPKRGKGPKKPVQNPRPKLDVQRILDEQGLAELLKMASDITFKPGREVSDMKKTLALVELWSHRLFPKYTFHDFLTKCESLGTKRPIKTHLRKVRLGQIPI